MQSQHFLGSTSVMHEGKSYSLTVEHKGFISCSLFQRYQSKSFQK